MEGHIRRIDEVFTCTIKAKLQTCKPTNCEILWETINYLVRMVENYEIRTDPQEVAAELTSKAMKRGTHSISFLGSAICYRSLLRDMQTKCIECSKLYGRKVKNSPGLKKRWFTLKISNVSNAMIRFSKSMFQRRQRSLFLSIIV